MSPFKFRRSAWVIPTKKKIPTPVGQVFSPSGTPKNSSRSAQQVHTTTQGSKEPSRRKSASKLNSSPVTILPSYSAPNTPQPLQGIVKERSGGEYEPHVHWPRSPTITPLGVQHTGQPNIHGHAGGGSIRQRSTSGSHVIHLGLHPHHSDKHNGRGTMPFQVTDAHRKQDVQKILDRSGGGSKFTTNPGIPMPSHGDLIFIVEEWVTLDAKDPETGEYIPLEQYYANIATRRPPQQDQFMVIKGVPRLKTSFFSGHTPDRTHERRSHEEHFNSHRGSLLSRSNHVRHKEGLLSLNDFLHLFVWAVFRTFPTCFSNFVWSTLKTILQSPFALHLK